MGQVAARLRLDISLGNIMKSAPPVIRNIIVGYLIEYNWARLYGSLNQDEGQLALIDPHRNMKYTCGLVHYARINRVNYLPCELCDLDKATFKIFEDVKRDVELYSWMRTVTISIPARRHVYALIYHGMQYENIAEIMSYVTHEYKYNFPTTFMWLTSIRPVTHCARLGSREILVPNNPPRDFSDYELMIDHSKSLKTDVIRPEWPITCEPEPTGLGYAWLTPIEMLERFISTMPMTDLELEVSTYIIAGGYHPGLLHRMLTMCVDLHGYTMIQLDILTACIHCSPRGRCLEVSRLYADKKITQSNLPTYYKKYTSPYMTSREKLLISYRRLMRHILCIPQKMPREPNTHEHTAGDYSMFAGFAAAFYDQETALDLMRDYVLV